MAILNEEERAHRAFLLELTQALRLPPGTPFQDRALKTLVSREAMEDFLDRGSEDDWNQLQRNCLERVGEVMQNLDALTRNATAHGKVRPI